MRLNDKASWACASLQAPPRMKLESQAANAARPPGHARTRDRHGGLHSAEPVHPWIIWFHCVNHSCDASIGSEGALEEVLAK